MPQHGHCSSQSDPSWTTSLFKVEKWLTPLKARPCGMIFCSLTHWICYWLQVLIGMVDRLKCTAAPSYAKQLGTLNWKPLIKISRRTLLFSKRWRRSLNLNQSLDLRDLIIYNICVRLFDCSPCRAQLIHRTQRSRLMRIQNPESFNPQSQKCALAQSASPVLILRTSSWGRSLRAGLPSLLRCSGTTLVSKGYPECFAYFHSDNFGN